MPFDLQHLPLARPSPDAGAFVDALMGRRRGATPLIEYLVDEVVMRPIVTDVLGKQWVPYGSDRQTQQACLDRFIEFWYRLGYDFVRYELGLGFDVHRLLAEDTAAGSDKDRAWADEHRGSIASWEDFERYPWPSVAEMDFFPFEYISTHLPEGMGMMTCHAAGIFENVSQIMSLEGLCLVLYDQPDLVRAVAQQVGERMGAVYRHLLDLPNVIAIFQGDDMGFRTGTLIAPADLKAIFLPWQKQFAQMTHDRGLPYFMHSCGNLETIMDHLIDEVHIDAKHSYEDAILPVQQFQERYGNRIAVLGGMDVDVLAASTPERVREHTRFLVETCGARGRYAIGSGNSIPSYVPVENYLAMVDEAVGLQGRPR